MTFECSLLNSRFRQVQTLSLDEASIDAATRSASAILQHELPDRGDLIGFELRRGGLRVRTCLESLKTAPFALLPGVGEGPRGHYSVF
jgi:hypothetical protein